MLCPNSTYSSYQNNKYFELKKYLWGCCPNLKYLLPSVAALSLTIGKHDIVSYASVTSAHTHTHTHFFFFFFFCTPCPRGRRAEGLEPVYSHSKSSEGEVTSLTPDFTLDLRAAGCLSVDGRRWPPLPQPTQAQGVRWKMVDGRRPRYVVRWTYDGRSLLATRVALSAGEKP